MENSEIVTRPAFHENALPFGPCVGPFADPDGKRSWFCQGFGVENMDPLADTIRLIITCSACQSMRQGLALEREIEEYAA